MHPPPRRAVDGAYRGEAAPGDGGDGRGVVVRGGVLIGPNAVAGEWGHNALPWPQPAEQPGPACYCGRRGCIETFLSGPALEREHVAAGGPPLAAGEIARRAEAGEAVAAGRRGGLTRILPCADPPRRRLCTPRRHRMIPPAVDASRAVVRRPSAASAGPPRTAGVILALLFALAPLAPGRGATALAQRTVPITGDRLSGTVLPIEPLDGDIELAAMRGWTWTIDDTKRILLDGDVMIHIAGHEFTAATAVVWINRLPSAAGLINQIAVYFEHLDNARRRSGAGVAGDRLLVTGSARGAVRMEVALLEKKRPPPGPVLRRAEQRLALHRRRLLGLPQTLSSRPQMEPAVPPHRFAPEPGGTVEPEDYALPSTFELPSVQGARPWLRDPDAIVRIAFGTLEVIPGEVENVIVVTGSVVIEYTAGPRPAELSQLTLSADRAVIFTEPGPLEKMAAWELQASLVRGIYLEGNVSTDANNGEYHLRAPRIYYDFRRDRAIMLDAVLRTYDRDTRIPIYSRAKEMRQIAANQWDARRVRVTTSEFNVGHFALGAGRMTITRRPVKGAEDPNARETYLQGRNITLRMGRVPFFYWPWYSGTPRDTPLRNIQFGVRDNDGLQVKTKWNLYALIGEEAPPGLDAELKLDLFTQRGEAVGLDLHYDLDLGHGGIDLYGMKDSGVDRVSTGRQLDPQEDFRGVALWEHQTHLTDQWLLQAQVSYISDETFISARRRNDFDEHREYETSLYLKRQTDRSALTLLASYDLNDFISNSYLLASAGYQVDRTPEIAYRRFGDPLFGGAAVYSGETRLGRVRIVPEESTPRRIGVRGRVFGIGDDVPVSDAVRARGITRRYENRFDSRHELAFPTSWGDLNITPFVVARLTAYEREVEEFSEDADSTRVFGALGVRLNTQVQRVQDGVESRLLDLHRLRHIIEPSATLWFSHADVSDDDLPVYDLDVESLGTGAVVRLGLRNVLQTQRGGPGRWRSVDFLKLDTDIVLNSDDANRESPTPQFFDFRPEYSQFGDHTRAALVWMLSDALTMTSEAVYDLDDSQVARASIGANVQHSPAVAFWAEFRFIEASNNELLSVGSTYRLSPKYRVQFSPQWDFRESTLRAVTVGVTRSFPNFDFIVRVRRDDILGETTFSANLGLVRF